jgi:hypothetical protein
MSRVETGVTTDPAPNCGQRAIGNWELAATVGWHQRVLRCVFRKRSRANSGAFQRVRERWPPWSARHATC